MLLGNWRVGQSVERHPYPRRSPPPSKVSTSRHLHALQELQATCRPLHPTGRVPRHSRSCPGPACHQDRTYPRPMPTGGVAQVLATCVQGEYRHDCAGLVDGTVRPAATGSSHQDLGDPPSVHVPTTLGTKTFSRQRHHHLWDGEDLDTPPRPPTELWYVHTPQRTLCLPESSPGSTYPRSSRCHYCPRTYRSISSM